MIRLTIGIPTVVGREQSLEALKAEINQQIKVYNLEKEVEVLVDKDNKEVSIGLKRNRMYQKSKGIFTVQIDDDDWIAGDFVTQCYKGTLTACNCIGYHELCTFDGGNVRKSDFSLKHTAWREFQNPINGFHHFRTPFFKTPIRTDICRRVGVKDMRWGEDHDFAKRIYSHLHEEYYINKVMYHYRYKSEEFNKKYGIKDGSKR